MLKTFLIDYGILVIPLGAVLAASLAGIFTIQAARRRNTLDSFIKIESSNFYRDIKQSYYKTIKKTPDLTYETELDSEEKLQIHRLLDHYETIAIGIRYGALNEKICKKFMRSTILRDFKRTEEYIKGLRIAADNNNAIWIEFEELAKTWEENKHFQPCGKRFFGG